MYYSIMVQGTFGGSYIGHVNIHSGYAYKIRETILQWEDKREHHWGQNNIDDMIILKRIKEKRSIFSLCLKVSFSSG
jgi:hypothetical protein